MAAAGAFWRRISGNWYSVRWRLPLSYAAIALLTAVALGGLLLFTLRRYYDQQERKYLTATARIVIGPLEEMYRDNRTAEEIQSSVQMFAFLAQARVRLLDESMQEVADSGPVSDQAPVSVSFPGRDETEPAGPPPDEANGPYLTLGNDATAYQTGGPAPDLGYRVPGRRSFFGQFQTDDASSREPSDQRVMVAVYGPTGEIVNYLELSEGLSFGREIVNDVAEKTLFAGAAAVLLAALVGGAISRGISQPALALAGVTTRMAQGDLTARAEMARRDEFGQLADTFNSMARRIEATVNALRQFVADAAHEINTPLTALRTNLELTTGDAAMPDSARADIDKALAELTRLERLTRNLLTLARLEAPDVTAPRSTVDLAALVRQLYERYASRAEQSGVALSADLPQEPVMVEVDQAQISRMLDNLLDNALKFTPSGGQVTVALHMESSGVRLTVQDTGVGIPESDLPQLFSRFHRGRNAASFPGNGLGLAIVKAVVEEHGGQIEVKSSREGSCFTINLSVGMVKGEKSDRHVSHSTDRG